MVNLLLKSEWFRKNNLFIIKTYYDRLEKHLHLFFREQKSAD